MRKLQVSRGDIRHDPMFRPQWVDGLDVLMPTPTPEKPLPLPPEKPLPLLPENPMAQKWQAVLDQAGAVTERLKVEADFDGALLSEIVIGLIDTAPSAEQIIEAYHQRVEMRRG